MPRQSKETDFTVTVEGIGSFTFGRRKMADEVAIQREYANILSGVQPTPWLDIVATWLSAFKVLMVFAPSSWDIDEMDPLDQDTYDKMKLVYDALSEKELSFRRKPGVDGQGNSAASL